MCVPLCVPLCVHWSRWNREMSKCKQNWWKTKLYSKRVNTNVRIERNIENELFHSNTNYFNGKLIQKNGRTAWKKLWNRNRASVKHSVVGRYIKIIIHTSNILRRLLFMLFAYDYYSFFFVAYTATHPLSSNSLSFLPFQICFDSCDPIYSSNKLKQRSASVICTPVYKCILFNFNVRQEDKKKELLGHHHSVWIMNTCIQINMKLNQFCS